MNTSEIMEMLKDEPPQVAAICVPADEGGCVYIPGMYLRDYFAAKALVVAAEGSKCSSGFVDESNYRDLAKHAYAIADAMLEARSK